MNIRDFLEYGATGLVALMILVVLVPVVRAFIAEMRAGRSERQDERRERTDMRREHNEFIINHIQHQTAIGEQQTAALLKVREGLDRVCDRLGNGDLVGGKK